MIRELTGTFGILLVALGVGLIYRPAGIIALGVLLVAMAIFGFSDSKTKTGN